MSISELKQNIFSEREAIINHPVYGAISSVEQVQELMKLHVFAVWDFMSLLKSLQKQFTCVDTPWLPTKNAEMRRFINEIVLEEESDQDRHGNYKSHFEMYLEAMETLGIETSFMHQFIEQVRENGVRDAISHLENKVVQDFLSTTFDIVESNDPHKIVSAFAIGREDLIPDMFHEIVNQLADRFPDKFDALKYYLDRHIELDGDHHGPLSEQMLEMVCENKKIKWQEAEVVAKECLIQRAKLWTAIEEKMINLV
ncbi:MAG: DUF3050 domain-containing protein [Flavobacteriales bacterium]|jgi:hypothetical protein|nr:DUF3050 domain-containing protein [Flavobacteriales bacterium]